MKILVINAGSSSLKYQFIDMETEKVIAKGLCERIGIDGKFTYKTDSVKIDAVDAAMPDHSAAIKIVLDALVDEKNGVIKSMKEIDAVGHRIVHGGEAFNSSVLLTDDVLNVIEGLNELAPLHNPANLTGVKACKQVMGDIPMVGVFDTAFHQTMPAEAFMYALPYEDYEKLHIRRYGFHGTSHNYVSKRAIKMLGKPVEDTKIITCHLGNGSSITAVKGGKSIDTSMGFTPLAGVPMGTRSGDIDPAIITYLMKKHDLDAKGVDTYINKNSGVQGISGLSSDFRDLDKAAAEGDKRAQLAVNTFTYNVKKYIGAYAAALNGVDAIVFTAGVGENDREVRKQILTGLEYLGVDVDFDYNENCPRGEEVDIAKKDSKVRVFVIPTNEELMIAMDTASIVSK